MREQPPAEQDLFSYSLSISIMSGSQRYTKQIQRRDIVVSSSSTAKTTTTTTYIRSIALSLSLSYEERLSVTCCCPILEFVWV